MSVSEQPMNQQSPEEFARCGCLGGPGEDWHQQMLQTAMLEDEDNCIPAAWEGFECKPHQIRIA
jgi:hypothetical protein